MAERYTALVQRFAGAPRRPAEPVRRSNAVTIGRDDHRPFVGESEIPDDSRLVRFRPGSDNQTHTFEQLRPGDLEQVARIYVFVHGWVPGSKAGADLLYATDGKVVTAWDPRISNVQGLSLVDSYVPLLAALAQRDPDAAVLWFSWVDQSGTDTGLFSARNSLSATSVNGGRLAIALSDVIGDGAPGVHLIGHSHGCIVTTHAALALPQRPAQLTLLDCPEDWFSRAGGAAGLLDHLLPRLQPGRGEGSTFIDAYASMFGRAYHDDPGLGDVVDVRLPLQRRPDDSRSPVSYNHQYAVIWYAQTVGADDAPAGFAWSVLQGFDPSELAAGYLVTSNGRLRRLAERSSDGTQDATASYEVETMVGAVSQLTHRNPDILVSLDVGDDALMVEFDYDFTRAGKDTRLVAALNHKLAFTASPDYRVPARGRFLRLPGDQSNVQVQFRLAGSGMLDSVTVGRLRVVRAPGVSRNLDDAQAMKVSAMLGAGAGVVGVLVVAGVVSAVRALFRRG